MDASKRPITCSLNPSVPIHSTPRTLLLKFIVRLLKHSVMGTAPTLTEVTCGAVNTGFVPGSVYVAPERADVASVITPPDSATELVIGAFGAMRMDIESTAVWSKRW